MMYVILLLILLVAIIIIYSMKSQDKRVKDLRNKRINGEYDELFVKLEAKSKGINTDVIDKVFNYLRWVLDVKDFPIYLEDDLEEVYFLENDEFEDTVRYILEDLCGTNIRNVRIDASEAGAVKSVSDLMILVERCYVDIRKDKPDLNALLHK